MVAFWVIEPVTVTFDWLVTVLALVTSPCTMVPLRSRTGATEVMLPLVTFCPTCVPIVPKFVRGSGTLLVERIYDRSLRFMNAVVVGWAVLISLPAGSSTRT